MRRIVIAPDSFKNSLKSSQVSECLEEGIGTVAGSSWHVETCPQADGGPGTVEAVVTARNGDIETHTVKDPLGEEVQAKIGWIESSGQSVAVIQMSDASGIELLENGRLDPLHANTFGTGQLLRTAAESGADKIILGLGGSATVDGGIGALASLGFEMRDADGTKLDPQPVNLPLVEEINNIDVPKSVRSVDFEIAYDVKNPLLGEDGAVPVYAPQKGADSAACEELASGMQAWAHTIETMTGKDLRFRSGTGAAGGLGFPLVALLGAELRNGAEYVMEVTNLNSKLQDADVLITGEGKIDRQTTFGKTPYAVAKRARKNDVRLVFGVTGELEEQSDLYEVFDLILTIPTGPLTKQDCINQADQLVRHTGSNFGRILDIIYSDSFDHIS